VLQTAGWPQMRWERLSSPTAWPVQTLDTTDLEPGQVADAALTWVQECLRGG